MLDDVVVIFSVNEDVLLQSTSGSNGKCFSLNRLFSLSLCELEMNRESTKRKLFMYATILN